MMSCRASLVAPAVTFLICETKSGFWVNLYIIAWGGPAVGTVRRYISNTGDGSIFCTFGLRVTSGPSPPGVGDALRPTDRRLSRLHGTHGSVCWRARARFMVVVERVLGSSANARANYTSPDGVQNLVVMFAPIPQLLILATISSGPALERSIWPAQIWKQKQLVTWTRDLTLHLVDGNSRISACLFVGADFWRCCSHLNSSARSELHVPGQSVIGLVLTVTDPGDHPASQHLVLQEQKRAHPVSVHRLTQTQAKLNYIR